MARGALCCVHGGEGASYMGVGRGDAGAGIRGSHGLMRGWAGLTQAAATAK